MVIGSFFDVDSRSLINPFIYTAWQVANVAATYFAFADEMVTIGYFSDAHETRPVPKQNAYPDVFLLSSTLLTKSLSVNPIS